jgi:hypothetical protein
LCANARHARICGSRSAVSDPIVKQGHFSRYYQAAFGELPSATLCRSRSLSKRRDACEKAAADSSDLQTA